MQSADESPSDGAEFAGQAQFYENCKAGDLEGLKTALRDHPNLNIRARHEFRETEWETPLHAAVKEGHFHIVGFLLALGADLETRLGPWESYTALHCAAVHAPPEMVRLLVDSGADAHAKYHPPEGGEAPALFLPLDGISPMRGICPVKQRHYDTIAIFLELGHDINAARSNGRSGGLLELAVQCNSLDLVKWLVDRGATPTNHLVGFSKVYSWPSNSPGWNWLAEKKGVTAEDCGGDRTLKYLVEELGLRDEKE